MALREVPVAGRLCCRPAPSALLQALLSVLLWPSIGAIADGRPFPPTDPDCELCQADRWTHWYAVTDDGWVADCEVCSVPMVVWWDHGAEVPADVVERLLAALGAAADERFGPGGWQLDSTMRQVPGHFHAHARDPDWWARRFSRALSRYTGVGGERVVRSASPG